LGRWSDRLGTLVMKRDNNEQEVPTSCEQPVPLVVVMGMFVLAQQLPAAAWPFLAIGAVGTITAVRRVPGRR
jgi:hypothetical protein